MHRNRQFIKFMVSGSISTLVNILSRFSLGFFISYPSSIVVSYIIGMATSYLIFKLWVFKTQRNNILRQLSCFLLINFIGLGQTLLISIILVNYVFFSIQPVLIKETLAHIIGLAIPIATSYIGHKHVTFK